MLAADEWVTGFVEQAERSAGSDALSAEAWAGLRADAQALGFFGLLAAGACAEPPQADPAVRDEVPAALGRDLGDALGEEGAAGGLELLLRRFREAKGERGPDLLVRACARVVYEVYDLRAHHLVQDDALAACDLMAWGGPGRDARELARRIVRLSRLAARTVLGHLEGQLDLVHQLGNPEAPIVHAELDRRLLGFAPRIYAQRLPSMARALLRDDKRFRLAFVLWGRLRGLVIGKAGLLEVAERIVPERPLALMELLEERRPARTALRAACEADPRAGWIEAAFLERSLPEPS